MLPSLVSEGAISKKSEVFLQFCDKSGVNIFENFPEILYLKGVIPPGITVGILDRFVGGWEERS